MHVPEDIARTASVHWEGDVAKGHGTIKTGSGKITADYSFGTRFAGEPGTNPEELLGASLAACFTMALDATLICSTACVRRFRRADLPRAFMGC